MNVMWSYIDDGDGDAEEGSRGESPQVEVYDGDALAEVMAGVMLDMEPAVKGSIKRSEGSLRYRKSKSSTNTKVSGCKEEESVESTSERREEGTEVKPRIITSAPGRFCEGRKEDLDKPCHWLSSSYRESNGGYRNCTAPEVEGEGFSALVSSSAPKATKLVASSSSGTLAVDGGTNLVDGGGGDCILSENERNHAMGNLMLTGRKSSVSSRMDEAWMERRRKVVDEKAKNCPPTRSPRSDGALDDCGYATRLLDSKQWEMVLLSLPVRYQLAMGGSSRWKCLYSSDRDGCSLRQMFRLTANKSPSVLLVQDSDGGTFGSYNSEPWRYDSRFYGTGESFVFSTIPDEDDGQQQRPSNSESCLNIYRWSKKNSNFMYGSLDWICIGSSPFPALRLIDGPPLRGTSGENETYDSPKLSTREDFTCKSVQLWCLV